MKLNVSQVGALTVAPIMSWIPCPDNATCRGHKIHDGSARGWHCSNSDCRYGVAENSLVSIMMPTSITHVQIVSVAPAFAPMMMAARKCPDCGASVYKDPHGKGKALRCKKCGWRSN